MRKWNAKARAIARAPWFWGAASLALLGGFGYWQGWNLLWVLPVGLLMGAAKWVEESYIRNSSYPLAMRRLVETVLVGGGYVPVYLLLAMAAAGKIDLVTVALTLVLAPLFGLITYTTFDERHRG